MADDWTSLPYNHIKDWSPIPDPKQFESDDGLLSSLYNLPNTIKRKLDTLFPTGSAQEDIKGLINKSRIEAIGTPNAAQIQANDPSVIKKIARTGVDTIANVAKGQLGIQPNPDETPIAKFANKIAQPVKEPDPYLTSLNEQAGLPDNQLQGGIPFKEGDTVFHGTRANFDAFDTNKGIGFLNKTIHFAENPEMAGKYAEGFTGAPRKGANVIAARLNVKNALDTSNIGNDDISALLNSVRGHPSERYLTDTINRLQSANPADHVNNADQILQNLLEVHPDLLTNAGFDGIKYGKEGAKVWSIFDPKNASTPWGTPLGKSNELTNTPSVRPIGPTTNPIEVLTSKADWKEKQDWFKQDAQRMRDEMANRPFNQEEANRIEDWARNQRNSAKWEGRNTNDIITPLTKEQQQIAASYKRIEAEKLKYTEWFHEQEAKLSEDQFFKPPHEIQAAHDAKIEQMYNEHEKLINRLTGGLEKPLKVIDIK